MYRARPAAWTPRGGSPSRTLACKWGLTTGRPAPCVHGSSLRALLPNCPEQAVSTGAGHARARQHGNGWAEHAWCEPPAFSHRLTCARMMCECRHQCEHLLDPQIASRTSHRVADCLVCPPPGNSAPGHCKLGKGNDSRRSNQQPACPAYRVYIAGVPLQRATIGCELLGRKPVRALGLLVRQGQPRPLRTMHMQHAKGLMNAPRMQRFYRWAAAQRGI